MLYEGLTVHLFTYTMIVANCTAMKTDCLIEVPTSSVSGESVYPDFAAVCRILWFKTKLTSATDQHFPFRR